MIVISPEEELFYTKLFYYLLNKNQSKYDDCNDDEYKKHISGCVKALLNIYNDKLQNKIFEESFKKIESTI